MSDAYSIEYAEQAERTLRRLDKATAKRIAHKIVWLAENASWRTPALCQRGEPLATNECGKCPRAGSARAKRIEKWQTTLILLIQKPIKGIRA